MAGLGAPELLIILLIIMLIFGGAKLPKLARSLGESSKEFKKGLNEGAGATTEAETPKPDTTNKTDTSQS